MNSWRKPNDPGTRPPADVEEFFDQFEIQLYNMPEEEFENVEWALLPEGIFWLRRPKPMTLAEVAQFTKMFFDVLNRHEFNSLYPLMIEETDTHFAVGIRVDNFSTLWRSHRASSRTD